MQHTESTHIQLQEEPREFVARQLARRPVDHGRRVHGASTWSGRGEDHSDLLAPLWVRHPDHRTLRDVRVCEQHLKMMSAVEVMELSR